MAYPSNKRGALLALAVSGGLWAWQNRDKISGWVQQQQQKTQGSANRYPGPSSTDMSGGSYTGSTRRMNDSGSPMGHGMMEGNEGRTSEI